MHHLATDVSEERIFFTFRVKQYEKGVTCWTFLDYFPIDRE
jgi:hypothetical protein